MDRSPVITNVVATGVVDAGAAEGQPRVGLHVEEVARPQVVVAVGAAGGDARG